jgi:hypothetical protein
MTVVIYSFKLYRPPLSVVNTVWESSDSLADVVNFRLSRTDLSAVTIHFEATLYSESGIIMSNN